MTDNTVKAEKATGLKIIGAGFGRTGTRSLKDALEILGFGPCYHMVEVFNHPDHAQLWEDAFHGKPVNWDDLLDGYQSTVDWPGCTFYEQLMQQYQDAKVLLSVRDPDKWYESAKSTIFQVANMTSQRRNVLLTFLMRRFMPQVRDTVAMIDTLVWAGTFHGNFADKEQAIAIFQQHNEDVKRKVPAEKLLVYNVKEGWEPLCAFLGVPVPDVPFPHLNDRANFAGSRTRRIVQLYQRIGMVVLALLAVGATVLILRRRSH